MSAKRVSRVGFEIETSREGTVTIEFTRTTRWGWENYGADADGNRGQMRLMIDEDESSEVLVSWDNDCLAFNEIPLAELRPDLRKAVEEALQEYIESHDPEYVEPPERDDEPSDIPNWWDD